MTSEKDFFSSPQEDEGLSLVAYDEDDEKIRTPDESDQATTVSYGFPSSRDGGATGRLVR